jgi:RNA-directed DNA polymerase
MTTDKISEKEIKILSVETPYQLSNCLRCSIKLLVDLIHHPVYFCYHIPKKRGGFREINAPEEDLKGTLQILNGYLQSYYLFIKPEVVTGFIPHKGSNILSNAQKHTGKFSVMTIDLKDFFPNISAKRVKNLFTSNVFRFNDQIATALTLLTTYQGKLPTGAPTSPVISNFICLELDKALTDYCATIALNYSRYADDLTFSSDFFITKEVIDRIKDIICAHHFEINPQKFRIKSYHTKQTVTGLVVNEQVNVDRNYTKRIRAMLHDCEKNGIAEAAHKHSRAKGDTQLFLRQLEGYLLFVRQIKGENSGQYLKMQRSFDAITNTSNHYLQTNYC